MIKKIPLSDLDSMKWNQLVLDSPNAPFYCLYEVLSSLNPNWLFVVEENESGDFDAGIAIPLKNFLWKKRIVQPAFCQQLGILTIKGMSKEVFLDKVFQELGISSWAYHFNESDSGINSDISSQWELKNNLVLDLKKSHEELVKGYSNNLKRKLKTAGKADLKLEKQNPDIFCPVFLSEYQALGTGTKKKALENLCSVVRKEIPDLKIDLEFVRDPAQKILAGGIFVGFGSRITYWSGFSSKEGKELGAMAFLMDEMISKSMGKYSEFDFETGNLEGTRRFFSQFKPLELKYPVLVRR